MNLKSNLCYAFVFLILTSCKSKYSHLEMNLTGLDSLSKKDTVAFITIKNTGTNPLIIYDYTSSCECTVLDIKKGLQIPSNDSTKIKIELLSDTINRNPKNIMITLKTNADKIFHQISISH